MLSLHPPSKRECRRWELLKVKLVLCCLDNQDSERIELIRKEKEFLNEKLIELKPLMNYQETTKFQQRNSVV